MVLCVALGACSFELRPGASLAIDAIDVIDADRTPRTLIFRDGLDGYTGTLDSYISDNVPGPHGAENVFIWDLVGDEEHALVRFTALFGADAMQIPPGSMIMTATLRLVIVEPTANVGMIREVAVSWDEATTWATFGPVAAIQPSDLGASRGPAPTTGVSVLDVTASVAGWSANPAANFGWLFSPGGTDGCDVASSEATNVVDRPELTVTFVVP